MGSGRDSKRVGPHAGFSSGPLGLNLLAWYSRLASGGNLSPLRGWFLSGLNQVHES